MYTKDEILAEKTRLHIGAYKHRPEKPLVGPIELRVLYVFPMNKGQAKDHAEWLADLEATFYSISKPDLDNTAKLLGDVLTKCGFWKDDCHVSDLCVQKRIGVTPRIHVAVYPLQELDCPPNWFLPEVLELRQSDPARAYLPPLRTAAA